VDLNDTQSPISEPTTMVYARELSVAALLEGVRAGRTVVKLQGPDDPMVELSSGVSPAGDTVLSERTRLTARVTGGAGHEVRFVHNGVMLPLTKVTSDPFLLERDAVAPEQGEDRYRVEVWVEGRPRTVTSHLWVARTADARGVPGPVPQVEQESGCGCRSAPGGWAAALGLAVAALWARRRVRQ
jgi:MYXO-CTERM domain-containing protein